MSREYIIHTSVRTGRLTNAMLEVYTDTSLMWLYFPVRSSDFFEVSMFHKYGLFKCRVYFMKENYKYAFYHGTTLVGKSNRFNDYKNLFTNYFK